MAKASPPPPSDEIAPVVQELIDKAEGAQFDPQQLVPGVRDFLLDIFKNRPKPWAAMTADEQTDLAAAATDIATECVRATVESIMSDGRAEPIRVLLTKFTHTDKIVISAEVKSFNEEETVAAVLGLHGARGKHMLLFKASVDDYRGDLGPTIDPDEPDLNFGHPDDDSDLADGE